MLVDKISSSCYRSSLIIRTCHVESGICTLSSRPCSLTLTRLNEISPGGASANRAQSLSRGDHYRIIAPAKINFARRAVRIREIPGKYQYRINYHVPVRSSTKASGEIWERKSDCVCSQRNPELFSSSPTFPLFFFECIDLIARDLIVEGRIYDPLRLGYRCSQCVTCRDKQCLSCFQWRRNAKNRWIKSARAFLDALVTSIESLAREQAR